MVYWRVGMSFYLWETEIMAKGYQKNYERMSTLFRFGRDLARRAKSKCELCGQSGVPLHVVEVSPLPEEPEFASCIFICETCQTELEHPERLDRHHWRCLYESVWSDVPAVQVTAVRLLQRLALDERWAADLLEQVYLQPDVEFWVEEAAL